MGKSRLLEIEQFYCNGLDDTTAAAYRNFANSIRSKATLEVYRYQLFRYCKFLKKESISKLLEDVSPKFVTESLVSYMMALRQSLVSYSQINVNFGAIKHFYIMNGVMGIDWERISRFKGENVKRNPGTRAYLHDEIKRMLDLADIKCKAIILTFASTGMRKEALAQLKMRDVDIIPNAKNIYKFTVYAGDTRHEHVTFCTPECYRAINSYLESRERAGEALMLEAPFFRADFDKRTMIDVRNPRHMNPRTISNRIRAISIAASVTDLVPNTELNPVGRRRNDIPVVHGFRYFTITQMGLAGVREDMAKKMTDHTMGVHGIYQKYNEEDLLREYVKAIDLLTISAEARLRRENELMKSSHSAEMDALRKEWEEFQRLHGSHQH